jgi:hypothetical protein
VAIAITQRKAYPYSEPILEATVMLPGPNTVAAMIKPGPADLKKALIFTAIKYIRKICFVDLFHNGLYLGERLVLETA